MEKKEHNFKSKESKNDDKNSEDNKGLLVGKKR